MCRQNLEQIYSLSNRLKVLTRNHGTIAVYLPNLDGGGAEKIALTLATGLVERGYTVDLVLASKRGPYLACVPSSLRIVELDQVKPMSGWLTVIRAFRFDAALALRARIWQKHSVPKLRALAPLARYLTRDQPAVLMTNMWPGNLLGILARRLAGAKCRLITVEHGTFSQAVNYWPHTQRQPAFYTLIAQLYEGANARVAVSDSVADDLAATTGLRRESIQTIYNPVVDGDMMAGKNKRPNHRFFEPGEPPVILAVGRLHPVKDFSTLIDAFIRVRSRHNARLIILGEGDERLALTERIAASGFEADVDMPGWVDNPLPYMTHANVLALTSRYEGLGNVLIEAMACGCPVVATDCPGGPREILAGGRYGPLVPVGDVQALADAIVTTLNMPIEEQILKHRAKDFSVDRSIDNYDGLIRSLLENTTC